MKKLLLTFSVIILTMSTSFAQSAEAFIPFNNTGSQVTVQNQERSTAALFDFLFRINIGATGAIAANGQAGVVFINNQYWISAWASNLLHILDANGVFIETITITGVTGVRSMTTNGTNLYLGTASTTIQIVDPVTRTKTGTIIVASPAGATTRMLTYDPTLNAGAGGFWIGSFDNAIASVSMTGDQLSSIDATTHGTVVYGGAIDNVSPGGPYLWIHDQTAEGGRDVITQISIATGAPTGVQYDYALAPGGNSIGFVSGGLFISDQVVPDKTAIIGLCQCDPSNEIFVIELMSNLGVKENDLSNFSIYPNPTNTGSITIKTTVPGEKQVAIVDVLGKTVMSATTLNDQVDISKLSSGVYLVRVSKDKIVATKKLVIK